MREHEDWASLPLNPDVRRYVQAVRAYQVEERQVMVRFAPMLCHCDPWYDWRDPRAPQDDCMIHTTVVFDHDADDVTGFAP